MFPGERVDSCAMYVSLYIPEPVASDKARQHWDNNFNLLMATVDGLKQLKRPEEVARLRGKEVREVIKPHSEVRAEEEAAAAQVEAAAAGSRS